MHWILIAAIGAGVGYLGGMFGKGGSAIATPLLAAVGVPPLAAVASPLPATVPGTLVAYRRYHGMGWRNRRVVTWSLAFGLPATVVGSYVTRWIGGESLVLVTDVVVALIGLRILLGRGAPEAAVGGGSAVYDSHVRLALVALTVGFVAGLLANAGGFLLVPLYIAVLKLPIKTALSSSLAVAAVLAVPGTIVHALLGHIDWKVTLVFGLASVPLSGLGARSAITMSPERLERIYGAGLLLLGGTLLAIR